MPIRIQGLEGFLKANGKAKVKMKKTIMEGLVSSAGVLLRKSQQLVPVDTSALKQSGRIETNDKAGMAAEAKVIYGGGVSIGLPGVVDDVVVPNAIQKVVDYAYVVHERLDVYHAPPTQARYLADAIPPVRGTITSIMRRQVVAGTRGV